MFCFFKQKTAYEMRISDWSSDVCSSDLARQPPRQAAIKAVEVGKPAAEHQGIGIEDVDDAGKGTGETILVALERGQGGGFAGLGARCQFLRAEESRVGKECVSTCRSRSTP